MLMVILIGLLLVGGVVAGLSQRIDSQAPRWVAMGSLALAIIFLAAVTARIAPEQMSLVTDPSQPSSWLMYYRTDWIPRFGISFELAMDGVSLILVWLTLLLGLAIAIVAGFLLLSGSVPIEEGIRPQAVPHADIDEQTEDPPVDIQTEHHHTDLL